MITILTARLQWKRTCSPQSPSRRCQAGRPCPGAFGPPPWSAAVPSWSRVSPRVPGLLEGRTCQAGPREARLPEYSAKRALPPACRSRARRVKGGGHQETAVAPCASAARNSKSATKTAKNPGSHTSAVLRSDAHRSPVSQKSSVYALPAPPPICCSCQLS